MRQCEGQMKQERKTVRFSNHKRSVIVFFFFFTYSFSSSLAVPPTVLVKRNQWKETFLGYIGDLKDQFR